MAIKKYTDWDGWWDGLRTNLLKCIGTTGLAYLGTNALQGMGAVGLGINWEQALGFFGVHIAFEVFTYLQKNQPQVITETVDTSRFTKAADGSIESGSSTKTTTIPVDTTPKPS